jgi:hypothetical protein
MPRYFGYNSFARAIRSSSQPVDGFTGTTGGWNATYVSNAIGCGNNGSWFGVVAPFDNGSVALTDFFSLRFDTWQSWSNSRAVAVLYDTSDHVAYQMIRTGSGTAQVQYWDFVSGAWVNWGGAISGLVVFGNQTHVWNITPGVGYQYYVDNILMSDDGGAVPSNAATDIGGIRHFSTASGGTVCTWSQIMCASYDLRDSHLMVKPPDGEGTYTDGTGTYADVDEAVLNDGDAIGLPNVGDKHTFTHTAFPALPPGLAIMALRMNARVRVGGNTVSDGQMIARSAGVDSFSTDIDAPDAYEGRGREWVHDPATGALWTKAGADAAQIGLGAV